MRKYNGIKIDWFNDKELLDDLAKRNIKFIKHTSYSDNDFECLTCGRKWKASIDQIRRSGCAICRYETLQNKFQMSFDAVIKKLKSKNITILCTEPYKNQHQYGIFKCDICDHEWETQYMNLLSNYLTKKKQGGCPICAHKKRILNHKITKMNKRKYINENYGDQSDYRYKTIKTTRVVNKYYTKFKSSKTKNIDHKCSIKVCFFYDIPIWIAASPLNLEVLNFLDNQKKKAKCSIEPMELVKKFNEWIIINHDYAEMFIPNGVCPQYDINLIIEAENRLKEKYGEIPYKNGFNLT